MKPRAVGKHYILELYDCPLETLNNEQFLCDLVKDGAKAADTTLLTVTSHHFSPQGVTVLGLLAESHLSIHTWPENGYAAVDLFTCGDNCRPEKACEFIAQSMQAKKRKLKIVIRGKDLIIKRSNL